MVMKMNACATVGSVWPTFSVPGICSSRHQTSSSRNIDVVVANEPMPSVSKKLVTNPIAEVQRGRGTGSCAPCAPAARRA